MKKKILSEEMKKDLFQKLSSAINLKDSNSYEITINDAEKMYRILNQKLFNSKLPKIRIEIENVDLSKIKENSIDIGDFKVHIDEDSLSKFTQSFKFNDLILEPYILIRNFRSFQFESIVAVLIHEMIHFYDYLYGQGKTGMIVNFYDRLTKQKETYDTHGTYFGEHMKRIKKESGINVEREFDFVKALPKKVQEDINKIKDSKTFKTNNCKDKVTLKLAKMIRAAILDDGTNSVEIDKNGGITISIS